MENIKLYADLSVQQRIKCAQLLQYFNEERSVQLTEVLEKHGENTLKNVLTKLQLLININEENRKYNEVLSNTFTLNEEVTLPTIISKVSRVRRELGLLPYTTTLNKSCVNDFLKLFIVKTTISTIQVKSRNSDEFKTKKVKTGYTPVFKLQPDI